MNPSKHASSRDGDTFSPCTGIEFALLPASLPPQLELASKERLLIDEWAAAARTSCSCSSASAASATADVNGLSAPWNRMQDGDEMWHRKYSWRGRSVGYYLPVWYSRPNSNQSKSINWSLVFLIHHVLSLLFGSPPSNFKRFKSVDSKLKDKLYTHLKWCLLSSKVVLLRRKI